MTGFGTTGFAGSPPVTRAAAQAVKSRRFHQAEAHAVPAAEVLHFARFGAADVRITVRYDTLFAETLSRRARERHIRAGTQGEKGGELDHAAMIPLIFLREALGETPLPDIVRVGLSGLPLKEHYRLGMLIRDTAEGLGRCLSRQVL